jgi:hypothetical protein
MMGCHAGERYQKYDLVDEAATQFLKSKRNHLPRGQMVDFEETAPENSELFSH